MIFNVLFITYLRITNDYFSNSVLHLESQMIIFPIQCSPLFQCKRAKFISNPVSLNINEFILVSKNIYALFEYILINIFRSYICMKCFHFYYQYDNSLSFPLFWLDAIFQIKNLLKFPPKIKEF